MTTNESPREAALRALSEWAKQHQFIRPRLIASAWRAGERNIRALARAAKVSRDTVYADLVGEGIDYHDRSGGAMPEPKTTVTTRPDESYLLQVVITSYGILHRTPPEEDALTVNLTKALRNPPEDPEVRDRMVQLNGLDEEVRNYVLNTDGALNIVGKTADKIRALVDGWGNPTRQIVRVHIVCQGGRHRSVAIAEEIAVWLRAGGYGVEVDHLDITKPVVV